MYTCALNFNLLENIEHNTKQISWDDISHFRQLFMNELNAITMKILEYRHFAF